MSETKIAKVNKIVEKNVENNRDITNKRTLDELNLNETLGEGIAQPIESPNLIQSAKKARKSYKQHIEQKCTECDFTTTKRLLLKKHCIVNHADKLDPEFLLNMYKCDFCEKIFKDPIQLSNHKNVHLGLKPYKCVECEHMFTTRGELIRHTRYKHTLERPHKCTICDYSSVELSKLKRHMRVHTDERPYLCPYCDYAGKDTFKLKRHLRVHTGEKPYECPICNTSFSQSNSLKVHMKTSHAEGSRIHKKNIRNSEKLANTTGTPPTPHTSISKTMKCEIKATHNESNIESPMLKKVKSTYYSCIDDSYYTNKDYLKNIQDTSQNNENHSNVHMPVHTMFVQNDVVLENDNLNIFTCTECSMKVTSVDLLNEHMVKHTGERPFKCEICNMKFGAKFALRSHKLSHDVEYTEKLKTKLKIINDATTVTMQNQQLITQENENSKSPITDKTEEITNKLHVKSNENSTSDSICSNTGNIRSESPETICLSENSNQSIEAQNILRSESPETICISENSMNISDQLDEVRSLISKDNISPSESAEII